MADTFTQLPAHAVFAVRFREHLVTNPWRDRLHSYIAGILASEADKSLAVGGWKDHVHVFFELKPAQCVADVMRVVKANISKWINGERLTRGKFAWQEGYGAFARSRSERHRVIQYIMNQEAHHAGKTFRQEYTEMLEETETEYSERHLFEFFD